MKFMLLIRILEEVRAATSVRWNLRMGAKRSVRLP